MEAELTVLLGDRKYDLRLLSRVKNLKKLSLSFYRDDGQLAYVQALRWATNPSNFGNSSLNDALLVFLDPMNWLAALDLTKMGELLRRWPGPRR